MARSIKKEHRIGQMISCYQKDLDFFKDHKGNMHLSEYLIEAGYHYAGDTSRDEKRIVELKEAKQRIAGLEKKVSFQDAIIRKLQNKEPVETIESTEITDRWWKEQEEKIQNAYNHKIEPNWHKLFLAAVQEYQGIPWTAGKDVKNFVLTKRKNEDGATT